MPRDPDERPLAASRWRPQPGTIIAVVWIFGAALGYLLPSLVHGTNLGSVDLLSYIGLGHTQPLPRIHNLGATDQADEMIPWAALAWSQVHHGHFPLWNPYSGFGMPLFANFVSAPLSLPMLVSYLAPERFVFTIEVYGRLIIAGTGVLWMCRRIGLGNLASTLAATAFMLSGSFTGWLGWPMTGTMAWLGWATGAAILVIRGERRTLHAAGLAVAMAFAVYAGHPETLIIVVMCVVVVAVAELVELGLTTRCVRLVRRAVLALGAGALGAMTLGAPLLLPGLQVIGRSARTSVLGYPLRSSQSVNLLFATYHGLPLAGSKQFGTSNYSEEAAYVGVVVVVLAALAVLRCSRNGVVVGLTLVGVICAALAYSSRLSRFLDTVPTVKYVQWTRALTALDFAFAVLAGFGLQVLLDRHGEKLTRWSFALLSAASVLLMAGLWVHHERSKLPALEFHIQTRSFIWPAVDTGLLLVAALLFLPARPSRAITSAGGYRSLPVILGAVLFGTEAVFLLTATPWLMSASNTFFATTPAEATYHADVGQARVGFAACPSITGAPGLGIVPEGNDAYAVAEAAAYDGTVPKSYFTAYFNEIRAPVPKNTGVGEYCPAMISATVARHFGVSYILAAAGSPAPPGAVLDTIITNEVLYSVPGAGLVTVEPDGAPPDSANAKVAAYTEDDPSVVRTVVSPATKSTVYIHLTDSPGWRASIDGHPLALRPWGGTMLAASVPAGRHVIVLTYLPRSFLIGVLLAVGAAVVLLAACGWSVFRGSKASDRPRTIARDAQMEKGPSAATGHPRGDPTGSVDRGSARLRSGSGRGRVRARMRTRRLLRPDDQLAVQGESS